jgi:hypothetical protein
MKSIDNERLIDYHNNNRNRKLQDLFPYNSTLAGLNGVYFSIDDGNAYYINTPCIVAFDKIILKDETYLLIDLESDEIEESQVKVLDAFYNDGSVFILTHDLLSDQKRIISQFIECSKDVFPWFLIDPDFFCTAFTVDKSYDAFNEEFYDGSITDLIFKRHIVDGAVNKR